MSDDEDKDESDDGVLEEAYESKKAKTAPAPVVEKRMAPPTAAVEDSDDDGSLGPDSDDEDAGGEASTSALPVHESLLPGAKAVKAKKVKSKPYVPEGETREERDGRTIFVGNLGVEVAKSKVRRSPFASSYFLKLIFRRLRCAALPSSTSRPSPRVHP